MCWMTQRWQWLPCVTQGNAQFAAQFCTCPQQELGRTDVAYSHQHTEEVKARVEAAHSEDVDERVR